MSFILNLVGLGDTGDTKRFTYAARRTETRLVGIYYITCAFGYCMTIWLINLIIEINSWEKRRDICQK